MRRGPKLARHRSEGGQIGGLVGAEEPDVGGLRGRGAALEVGLVVARAAGLGERGAPLLADGRVGRGVSPLPDRGRVQIREEREINVLW